jgi:phosphatidate cytidylyltransferase
MAEEEKAQEAKDPTQSKSKGIDRLVDRMESRRDRLSDQFQSNQLRGQKARGAFEKLITRSVYGALYAIITAGCLFAGRTPTAVVVALMAWLCCSEFFRMCRMAGRMPNEVIGLTAAVLFPAFARFFYLRAMVFVIFLLLISVGVWYVLTPRANIADVAITVFGPIYTSLTFSCVVLIRNSDPGMNGAMLTLGVMLSIWANDSVAYLVGSRIGVHKMAPRISPKKSWEGFWAGLVGSIIVWVIIGVVHLDSISLPLAIIIGIVEGFMSVVGDLFESRIKRGVGVKDSGNIMPGHGGLLDRSDSMIFGSMVAYVLLVIGGVI